MFKADINVYILVANIERYKRRLCFYTCLSVILFTEGEYLSRYTPLGRYTPWQVHPSWAGTPLGRYTPQAGTPPPPFQVHPQAGTLPPPGQVHPLLLGRYTPWAGTPLPRLGDTGNKWAVHILLESILVFKQVYKESTQSFSWGLPPKSTKIVISKNMCSFHSVAFPCGK